MYIVERKEAKEDPGHVRFHQLTSQKKIERTNHDVQIRGLQSGPGIFLLSRTILYI
jgi:hypothetical protein